MNRETLDSFIEKQCEQASDIGNEDGRNGYLQAEMIQWAVDQFLKTNSKIYDLNKK